MAGRIIFGLGVAVLVATTGVMVASFFSKEVFDFLAMKPDIILEGLIVGGILVIAGVLMLTKDEKDSPPRRQ